MGLPNMKRNADQFAIESAVGVGTTIEMSFCLQQISIRFDAAMKGN